jgi:hypothetical protein
MNGDACLVHRPQLGFGGIGIDEHLEVGTGIPRVATMGTENVTRRGKGHMGESWMVRSVHPQGWRADYLDAPLRLLGSPENRP